MNYRMDGVKYKGEKYRGPGYQSPYPLDRLSPSIELVELAREVSRADEILVGQATGKLQLLAEQIRELQARARQILTETRHYQELHRAQCGFKKIPGHSYRKPDGSLLFSLIGPAEWTRAGRASPYEYIGTYRLEQDRTWEEVDENTGRDLNSVI